MLLMRSFFSMELLLAGESRPDTTDLNIKIMIKKKSCGLYVPSCVRTSSANERPACFLRLGWLQHLLEALNLQGRFKGTRGQNWLLGDLV